MSPSFEPEHGFFASQWRPDVAGGRNVPGRAFEPGLWSGLLIPDVPGLPAAGRDREHDQTEPDHHHSHKFECKCVHGNSPNMWIELGERVDRLLIRGTGGAARAQMVDEGLRSSVNVQSSYAPQLNLKPT
jgi:hypothetical protein